MNIKEGTWNAGHVFQALSRIGYEPVSALLDLVDNSVSANATNIVINVETDREEQGRRGRPRAVLKSFVVADNGCGMDEEGLANALTLGSSTQLYGEHTLSKFGMGLKTATASLGKRLEIVSRPKEDPANVYKAVLDQDSILEAGKYVYHLTEPTEEDLRELNACAQGESGTLIRVTKLLLDSLPRTSEIVAGLKSRAGVIYYYFLKGLAEGSERLSLKIDEHEVAPVDPLFVDEIADGNDGDLNEHTWDGLSPKWIARPQRIQLATAGTLSAEIAMTQLPHPSSVARLTSTPQKRCRDRYLIGPGNYGFYIYRNWRLISWADSLGCVRHAQDLYAFRGRLLINSDADDVLNINVTKSRIQLSEIAQDQLMPRVQEAMKRSIVAWNNAKQTTKRLLQPDPHDAANEALNRISTLQADEDWRDEILAPLEEKQTLEARRTKAASAKPINREDRQRINETGQRVLYVDTLDNNQLWERAHHPEHGLIVRVNRSHRFCRHILDTVPENGNLQKIIDVLFFAIARGEYDLVYKSNHEDNTIEEILAEYREEVGGTLSDVVRRLNLTEFLSDGDV